MAKKPFQCPRCDRSFSMKAHLARHVSAMHTKKRRGKAKPRKIRKTKRVRGRPRGAAGLGLRTLSLEELGDLIVAARAEARRRVTGLQKALK